MGLWILDWQLAQIQAEREARIEAHDDLTMLACDLIDTDRSAALQAWLLAGESAKTFAQLASGCDYLNELD